MIMCRQFGDFDVDQGEITIGHYIAVRCPITDFGDWLQGLVPHSRGSTLCDGSVVIVVDLTAGFCCHWPTHVGGERSALIADDYFRARHWIDRRLWMTPAGRERSILNADDRFRAEL